jgi:hypothetical protein
MAGLFERLPVSQCFVSRTLRALKLIVPLRYNFVELSYFLAYVQAEYVKTHMASTAMATLRPPVVDVGISVELGGGVVLVAVSF